QGDKESDGYMRTGMMGELDQQQTEGDPGRRQKSGPLAGTKTAGYQIGHWHGQRPQERHQPGGDDVDRDAAEEQPAGEGFNRGESAGQPSTSVNHTIESGKQVRRSQWIF